MNVTIRKFLSSNPLPVHDLSYLLMRVCFGLLLSTHGYGKIVNFYEYATTLLMGSGKYSVDKALKL